MALRKAGPQNPELVQCIQMTLEGKLILNGMLPPSRQPVAEYTQLAGEVAESIERDFVVRRALPHEHARDPYLSIQQALTEDAREVILATAHARNPHLNGADVADILDIYDQHDICLWFTEKYWEAKGDARLLAPRPYYRAAALVVALLLGSTEEPNPLTALLVDLLAQQAANIDDPLS